MDYSTLIAAKTTDGSIKNWCNYSLVPAEVCLTEAEAWIYSKLRVREMLTLASDTIAEGAEFLALPTGYVGTLSLRRVGSFPGEIELQDPELFEEMLVTDEDGALLQSCPDRAAVSASRLEFNCGADDAYPYRWWYYRSLDALSGDNLTNFLTSKYPHLLRTACIFRAFDHMKQWSASQRYEQQAASYINDANVAWDMERQEQRTQIHWGDSR